METQPSNFESAIREFLTPIITHAVDEAMSRYFLNYMANHPTEPDIYDIRAASQYLGLALSTIYTMTSRREIPHFKRGRRLMFRRSELDQWVQEGKRKTKWEISQEIDDYTARRWK
jgi:excisionase family DNA binding protein